MNIFPIIIYLSQSSQQTKRSATWRIVSWYLSAMMVPCFLGLILLGVVGCGSSEMDSEDLTIANVTVLPDDEPVISLGQDVQLQAVAKNSSGMEVSSGSVTWTSSDPSILAVTSTGLMTGVSGGTASVTVNAGGKNGSTEFVVADLSGTWVGGEGTDSVSYTLMQTSIMVEGVFQSRFGFPPITDVNTGNLTGSLNFARYQHTLELTTEDGCLLEIEGSHHVQVEMGGELILIPGTGNLSSSNCSISGTIDFTTLRRQ